MGKRRQLIKGVLSSPLQWWVTGAQSRWDLWAERAPRPEKTLKPQMQGEWGGGSRGEPEWRAQGGNSSTQWDRDPHKSHLRRDLRPTD